LVRAAANGPAVPAQQPPPVAAAGTGNLSVGLQRMREQQNIEDAERIIEQLDDVDDVAADLSAAEYDELQADALAQFETLRATLANTTMVSKLESRVAAVKAESARKRQVEDDQAHGRTGAQATAAPPPVRPARQAASTSAGTDAARAMLMGDDDDGLFGATSNPDAETDGKDDDDNADDSDDGDKPSTPASFGVLPRHQMSSAQGNLASEAAKKKAERLRYHAPHCPLSFSSVPLVWIAKWRHVNCCLPQATRGGRRGSTGSGGSTTGRRGRSQSSGCRGERTKERATSGSKERSGRTGCGRRKGEGCRVV
jgi:hypothetical protein